MAATASTDAQGLTLQEAADELGVHYMTAYRYVRLGMLPARKAGATWRVAAADLDAFRASRGAGPVRGGRGRSSAPWDERIESRLLAGDAAGAWAVAEAAMASGTPVDQVYLEVVGPAMRSVGARWERGEIDVADEHRASAVAARVLARLAPLLSRPGRSRGSVVLGGAPGDHHALAVTMVADLLAGGGFEVVDLGADVPAASLARAAREAQRLVAVGISLGTSGLEAEVEAAVAAVRAAVPGVPVVIGGQAVPDEAAALALGADGWAPDGRAALALIDALASAG